MKVKWIKKKAKGVSKKLPMRFLNFGEQVLSGAHWRTVACQLCRFALWRGTNTIYTRRRRRLVCRKRKVNVSTWMGILYKSKSLQQPPFQPMWILSKHTTDRRKRFLELKKRMKNKNIYWALHTTCFNQVTKFHCTTLMLLLLMMMTAAHISTTAHIIWVGFTGKLLLCMLFVNWALLLTPKCHRALFEKM